MSWLLEDPTAVIVVGLLLEVTLAIVLVNTGRARVILLMIAVAVVVGGCVLTEQLVVTEREEIEIVVDGVVDALLVNDLDKVSSFIAPDSDSLRDQAAHVMRIGRIHELKVTDGPDITIHELTTPKSADVEMIVRASAGATGGGSLYNAYVAKIEAKLRLENGQWLFVEATHSRPFGEGF